jgi:DNA-binding PadR family transcriptional regulator
LDQLFRKGYVTKAFGEPSAERGGRSKIYYRVLPAGLEALKSTIFLQHTLQRSLREAVPDLAIDEG